MDTRLQYLETEDPEWIEAARKRARKMEQMAAQQELIVSNMPKDDIEGIEATNEVNNMLVNSIRVKMQLLGKSKE